MRPVKGEARFKQQSGAGVQYGNKIKATTFKVTVDVTANKSYSTDISYQSISGEVLFSDVTWSNEKSDVPINVIQYRTGACTISSISHGWAIDQKVSFIVAVLYI